MSNYLRKCLFRMSSSIVFLWAMYLYSHNARKRSLRSLAFDRMMRLLGLRRWLGVMGRYRDKTMRLLKRRTDDERMTGVWRIGVRGQKDWIGHMPVHSWQLPTSRHHRCILYLHGGGYVMGATPFHYDFIHDMLKGSQSDIVYPVYFKAPHHHYQDAIQPLIECYRDIISDYGPENVTVMGDSAGGGLAMSLLMTLRDQGIVMPKHLILISPWLDMVMNSVDYEEYDRRDPFLNRLAMQQIGQYWAGNIPEISDYRLSPINGDLEGLPPIYCVAGTYDLLCVDTQKLETKMQMIGHPHLVRYGEKMNHIYPILPVYESLFIRQEICDIIIGNKKIVSKERNYGKNLYKS